jgi:hypothetical protein
MSDTNPILTQIDRTLAAHQAGSLYADDAVSTDAMRRTTNRTDGPKPMEWTGDVWAPVCPTDNIPMTSRDEAGWLRCGTCKRKAVDR